MAWTTDRRDVSRSLGRTSLSGWVRSVECGGRGRPRAGLRAYPGGVLPPSASRACHRGRPRGARHARARASVAPALVP